MPIRVQRLSLGLTIQDYLSMQLEEWFLAVVWLGENGKYSLILLAIRKQSGHNEM
ncbi:hypothetical protein [Pedobacter sp. L105]|uniref:hypothetical protein n=1 Tax=Pedobacter sp. L105 TaxID=1641871 RepID=UPI00131C41DC|nr:hypothetical protein [Pedobacter sp. L105]